MAYKGPKMFIWSMVYQQSTKWMVFKQMGGTFRKIAIFFTFSMSNTASGKHSKSEQNLKSPCVDYDFHSVNCHHGKFQ